MYFFLYPSLFISILSLICIFHVFFTYRWHVCLLILCWCWVNVRNHYLVRHYNLFIWCNFPNESDFMTIDDAQQSNNNNIIILAKGNNGSTGVHAHINFFYFIIKSLQSSVRERIIYLNESLNVDGGDK